MSLAEKLRKGREFTFPTGDTVGKVVWTIRRPSDIEMLRIRRSGDSASLLEFVIGWSKDGRSEVSEMDLGIPNGDPHPMKFNPIDAAEYLSDRQDIFIPLMNAITDAYTAHVKTLEDVGKN